MHLNPFLVMFIALLIGMAIGMWQSFWTAFVRIPLFYRDPCGNADVPGTLFSMVKKS
jgi:ABC-type xylose transport system permease subunit